MFLKKKDQIFDEQTYIEVNMTANIKVKKSEHRFIAVFNLSTIHAIDMKL